LWVSRFLSAPQLADADQLTVIGQSAQLDALFSQLERELIDQGGMVRAKFLDVGAGRLHVADFDGIAVAGTR
jgi:hypothetical protein